MTAGADQDERVAYIHLRDRVSGEDYGAALVRQQSQHEHHPLVQPGIETGGGLVQEQDLRLVQQFARDRDALALPAAERLHQLALLFQQSHGGQDLLNPGVPGRRRRPAPESQPRLVPQCLGHGEISVDDVFLWHVAHQRGVGLTALGQIDAVVGNAARGRGHLPGQQPHQRGLACSARPGHRSHAGGREPQRHVLEQRAAMPGSATGASTRAAWTRTSTPATCSSGSSADGPMRAL